MGIRTQQLFIIIVLFFYITPLSAAYRTGIYGLSRPKRTRMSPNNRLIQAALNGDFHEIEALTLANADPNATDTGFPSGSTSLIIASSAGHIHVVRALLNVKADPNKQDGSSKTPLCSASANNYARIVSLLIERNADPNLSDGHGIKALEHAIIQKYASMVSLLIDHKADIRAKTHDNKSLLSLACESGNTQIVSSLLYAKASADINRVDFGGGSPLRNAAINNHYDLVVYLIRSGANVHLCNGKIPHLSPEMFDLLRAHSPTPRCNYLAIKYISETDDGQPESSEINNSQDDIQKSDQKSDCVLL